MLFYPKTRHQSLERFKFKMLARRPALFVASKNERTRVAGSPHFEPNEKVGEKKKKNGVLSVLLRFQNRGLSSVDPEVRLKDDFCQFLRYYQYATKTCNGVLTILSVPYRGHQNLESILFDKDFVPLVLTILSVRNGLRFWTLQDFKIYPR